MYQDDNYKTLNTNFSIKSNLGENSCDFEDIDSWNNYIDYIDTSLYEKGLKNTAFYYKLETEERKPIIFNCDIDVSSDMKYVFRAYFVIYVDKEDWDYYEKSNWKEFDKIISSHLDRIENKYENFINTINDCIQDLYIIDFKNTYGDLKFKYNGYPSLFIEARFSESGRHSCDYSITNLQLDTTFNRDDFMNSLG